MRDQDQGRPEMSAQVERPWWIPRFLGPMPVGIRATHLTVVFLLTGGNVLMRMWATELFPTSIRNTAMGFETLVEATGVSLGFVLVGFLGDWGLGLSAGVIATSAMTVLGGLVIGFFPETAGRELEATSDTTERADGTSFRADPEARP